MWNYICNLPSHLVRDHVVGLLQLHDIVQLDLAMVVALSRLQLHALLEHFSVAEFMSEKLGSRINEALLWLHKRKCKISLLKLDLDKLSPDMKDFPQIDKCELDVPKTLTASRLELFHPEFFINVHSLVFCGNNEHVQALFRKLPNVSSLSSPYSREGAVSLGLLSALKCGWQIKSLMMWHPVVDLPLIEAIACNGSILEELDLIMYSSAVDPNTLLRAIANNCRQLRRIKLIPDDSRMLHVNDTGVITLAESCLLLERVNFSHFPLTDSSVVALAQHCKRLKRLGVSGGGVTYRSLLALSECGLPLESLSFPEVPIPEAQLPRCAHALSRIDSLSTPPALPALRLMPNLTLVCYSLRRHPASAEAVYAELLAAQCSTLKSLYLYDRISGALLAASANKNLVNLSLCCPVCDEDLALLAPSARHIKQLFIMEECVNVTDAGLLALSEHCWQLQLLYIPSCPQVTEAGLARVIAGCHQLTSLEVSAAFVSQETALRLRAQHRKLHITLKQP